jgi:hypothetical protein
MKRVLPIFAAAAAVLALGAMPSWAQSRVFVSGSGSDGNPCSLSAPCRSFQQAETTVLAGGEIVALDAAGYGPLNITKAITITAIGIEASITSNSTTSTAITINAGASDVVTIRGLTLISGFTSGDGIDINSAKSVTIRDCTVTGFPFEGIFVDPSANLDVELWGVDVDGSGDRGLAVIPTGGKLTMLVIGSTFTGNGASGISVNGGSSTGTINATFDVSAAANGGGMSGGDGIFVTSTTGKAQPVVMITGSKIVNNVSGGLLGTGPVQVLVDRTQITGNGGDGWQAASSAVVNSYKNNEVNGNTTDGFNGVTQITAE